ncbi:MAG TPA: hypothetical protein VGX23_13655 [Actinocrinis sp.]|nr:hypothetical protein [Actinocrinis sp.]
MATKTGRPRPGGPQPAPAPAARPPKARTAPQPAGKSAGKGAADTKVKPEAAPAVDGPEKSGGSFLRSVLLPSAGCGVLLALVAVQEGADLAVGVLMAVCMTGVIAGMIKLKNAMYGG